jgi:hypothetical protein
VTVYLRIRYNPNEIQGRDGPFELDALVRDNGELIDHR